MAKTFEMTIHNDLLRDLYLNGIDSNEAITFFTEVITDLQNYEPNFGPQKKNNFKNHTYPFYLVKGFYPNTSVMFRAILIDKNNGSNTMMVPPITNDAAMYAKITKGTYQLPIGTPRTIYVPHSTQQKLLESKAESLILEADIKCKEQFAPSFKAPRCVSPKGMPLFNLNRKKI